MLTITFLSDYGTGDGFAGICRAVIAREAPGALVVDISHEVPRQDVRRGAVLLADALAFLPRGVHLAVVDPGVGTARRAIAVRSRDGRLFVGPDNGLLALAIELAGGAESIVDLAASPHRLDPVAATFHGRDVFAPVAAALARGDALEDVGEALEPSTLVTLVVPRPQQRDGGIAAHALLIDVYGNVALDLLAADAELSQGEDMEVRVREHSHRVPVVETFGEADPGELVLYTDSSGRIALAVREGSAAEQLGIGLDDEVLIRGGEGEAA